MSVFSFLSRQKECLSKLLIFWYNCQNLPVQRPVNRFYYRGVYREKCQVRKIKISVKIINKGAGGNTFRVGWRKMQKLTPRVQFRIFVWAYFHILKLLWPFDREAKNISSLKDPFSFCQVLEVYLQTSQTCTM